MNIKQQRGLSPLSLIVVLVLVIAGILLAFKIAPPYVEYMKVKKTLKTLASSPDLRGANRGQVEGAFVRYALIDGIESVQPADLEISNEGGTLVLSANYTVKVPLAGNISALIEFHPTSEGK